MDMRASFLILLGLCVATTTQASKALINIETFNTFFDRPNQVISSDGVARIVYQVTNESSTVKSLFFTLPPGVGVVIGNSGRLPRILPLCSKFAGEGLRPHQSCLLPLIAVAAKIKSNGMSSTSGGPWVSLDSNGFSTFQPAPGDTLSISVSPLNASVTALALSVNNVYSPFYALTGTPRKITLSSGGGVVSNVKFEIKPQLPSDALVSPSNGICGTITPQTPCTITITPGATPTSNSSTLTVFEGEATSFSIPIDILSYNSIYQSGYVFAIDDTTPDTQSVGGKVAAKENQAPIFPIPGSIIWSSNGKTTCPTTCNKPPCPEPYRDCTSYDFIPGIDEQSTNPCDGNTDGTCDTQQIVSFIEGKYGNIPKPPTNINTLYAAGLCSMYITENYYSDWYLPAICELGYYKAGPNTPRINSGCGTPENPLLQNLASNLSSENLKSMQGPFWSSTEFSCTDGTCGNAWSNYFTSNTQTHDGKENTLGVRCVRAMTQPPSPTS